LGAAAIAACSPTSRTYGSNGTAGSGGTVATGGTGGAAGNGPKLVRSVPADGDTQAPLLPVFSLYFDRPVAYGDATGKITLTSDVVTTPTVSPVGACTDGSTSCIQGQFPAAFLDANMRLPGGTKHTITIDKSFKDPNGDALGTDVTVSFTTFAYDPNFFDDSTVIPMESGGLDYDPASQALFLCGADAATTKLIIRRIPVPGGKPMPATTYHQPAITAGGPYCYGLDVYDGAAYVSGTYDAHLFIYQNLAATAVMLPSTNLGATPLPVPNDTLTEVSSTAAFNKGANVFMGFGYFTGVMRDAVLAYQNSVWSVWKTSTNLFTPTDGFTVARGIDSAGQHVYLASGATIWKIREADATIENTFQLKAKIYNPQLRCDSTGRLYVADGLDLTVYDTSGMNGFNVLATRNGLGTGRMGLSEDTGAKNVTVYYMPFRKGAVIGTTVIGF
jgi:hypothetical protein